MLNDYVYLRSFTVTCRSLSNHETSCPRNKMIPKRLVTTVTDGMHVYLLAVDELMVEEEEEPLLSPAGGVHLGQLTGEDELGTPLQKILTLKTCTICVKLGPQ